MANREPRINLLRYQQEETLESRSNIQFVLILGLVVLLLVGAMAGGWWLQNQKLQALKAKNQQLQEQISQMSRLAVSTDTLAEGSDQVNQRSSMINSLEKQAKAKTKYLDEIYLLSIPGVTIGKMDVKSDNNFTISAYCSSQATFIKFLEKLRKLEFVKEVKNISSRCNDKTGEVNFNITLVWEEAK